MDIKKREKDILVSDDNFEAIFKIHGGKPLLCNYQGNNICQIALNEITTELEIKINKIIDCSCKWEDKDTISIFDIKTEFNLLAVSRSFCKFRFIC